MDSLALPCVWRCLVFGVAMCLLPIPSISHTLLFARLSWRLLNGPTCLYLSVSLAVNSEKGRVIAGHCGSFADSRAGLGHLPHSASLPTCNPPPAGAPCLHVSLFALCLSYAVQMRPRSLSLFVTTHTRAPVRSHTHVHTRGHTHNHIHTHTHTRIHTHTQTHTHMQTHSPTHTHSHTHTHTYRW